MATAGRVWEVLAVRYGTLQATCGRLFFRWSDYGEPDAEQRLDFYFWVLRGDGETVLVDTGFDPEVAERRGRTPLCPPREAFPRLAVTPSRVIVTHFHYDHVGNLSAFPDAQVWIPGRELEFWTSEPARRLQFAEHVEQREIAHLVERHRAGRAVTYGDGDELAPGVTAVALPGHSPGQHGVLVRSASGPVL